MTDTRRQPEPDATAPDALSLLRTLPEPLLSALYRLVAAAGGLSNSEKREAMGKFGAIAGPHGDPVGVPVQTVAPHVANVLLHVHALAGGEF